MRTVTLRIEYESVIKGKFETNGSFTGDEWSVEDDAILIHLMRKIEKAIIKEHEKNESDALLASEQLKCNHL